MFSKGTPTKESRTARRKIALIAAASLALTTVPFALAAPAQAATTKTVCTVKALKPEFAGYTIYKVTKVNYKIKVYCEKARDVNIKQERWEDDYTYWPPFDGNDFLGASSWKYHVGAGKTLIINNVRTLVNGEPGNEEVFHKAAIQEGSRDLDIWTDWSKWSVSANLSIS
ncbi:hypothetical protein SRABI83_03143 [Arthrobacter sp. Bi83]|jgi:hypothetical protein|uniref:hypothetical protein n=1 Tax=Arthrobacter sp. Bi83 TaxID=2822353 RepID=UPI001DF3CE74|nr:hypothetical protein [Arthrobacter sp. Bi83]CAH0251914.1 hypothetical protein SRABI83_03143 [Arthrobacter sp. Bi83]